MLKPMGYNTAHVGKWHLGVGKDNMYMPTNQGFDYYYGIPYTHSWCPHFVCFYPNEPCDPVKDSTLTQPGCPVFRDTTIVEQPADFTTLSVKYSKEARAWVGQQAKANKPFFLYYAFHQPHVPNFAGEMFRNATDRGVYGDMIAEMDWMVGEILKELRIQGIERETLVLFTSDNG